MRFLASKESIDSNISQIVTFAGNFPLGNRRTVAYTRLRLESASEVASLMKILLYNPDNGVTRNFMPHLWMFLLQALTPAGHDVVLLTVMRSPWMKKVLRATCLSMISDWLASVR